MRRVSAAIFLLAALCTRPAAFAAEDDFFGVGDAVGGFFRGMGALIFRSSPADHEFDRALETYEKGELYSTVHAASRLTVYGENVYRDEADLLRGMSSAAVDLRETAVAALERVLSRDPPSPYYAVALAELLEIEARFGNHRAAASIAQRRFVSFWTRPKNRRDASIKAIFLEQGRLSPLPLDRWIRLDRLKVLNPNRRDRPAERAVYLAGQALLREKRFEEATICFDAIAEESAYFPYARYALAQASYGLGNFKDADVLLSQVEAFPASTAGEVFLRDRSALLLAQLAKELDDDDKALRWVTRVRTDGPYAWHAALLAGEIRARRDDAAVALVYLRDLPVAPAEPKVLARAAALDAELRRDLGDTNAAVDRLQSGIRALDEYLGKLEAATAGEARLESLRRNLEERERARLRLAAWRRENLALAIPDLVDWSAEPGWVSTWVASVMSGDGTPVIYYPSSYDPFATLDPLPESILEPPNDGSFPAAFRKSLGRSLADVFAREHALTAEKSKTERELALLLLDGELRLAAMKDGRARPDPKTIKALGLGNGVESVLKQNLAPTEAMTAVLQLASLPAPSPKQRGVLRGLANEQLQRWRAVERDLLRRALKDERTVVEELRYGLDLELSAALNDKRELERSAIGGE